MEGRNNDVSLERIIQPKTASPLPILCPPYLLGLLHRSAQLLSLRRLRPCPRQLRRRLAPLMGDVGTRCLEGCGHLGQIARLLL